MLQNDFKNAWIEVTQNNKQRLMVPWMGKKKKHLLKTWTNEEKNMTSDFNVTYVFNRLFMHILYSLNKYLITTMSWTPSFHIPPIFSFLNTTAWLFLFSAHIIVFLSQRNSISLVSVKSQKYHDANPITWAILDI